MKALGEQKEQVIKVKYEDLVKEVDLHNMLTQDHISLIVREQ